MQQRQRKPVLRTLSVAAVCATIAMPVAGAAVPMAVPAPAPTVTALPGVVTPAALTGRYSATRADIGAAARAAAAHGDGRRSAALRAMADASRRFLFFDGRDGGRTVEVYGDLAKADRIAVLVPGAGTSVEEYWRLRDGAVAMRNELGERSAVIAWLGYPTPNTVSADSVTSRRAGAAAPGLRSFLADLGRIRPAARVSLLCHSYGSVVCARAASGARASAIVLYGSPGTGYDSAAALNTRAAVWAGRGATDWIGNVPHLKLRLPFVTVGFGTDPVSPEFGARPLPTGDAGHSDYLRPGSESLRNMAWVVRGEVRSNGGGDA